MEYRLHGRQQWHYVFKINKEGADRDSVAAAKSHNCWNNSSKIPLYFNFIAIHNLSNIIKNIHFD